MKSFMGKFLVAVIMVLILAQLGFCVDEFSKVEPAGTASPSDIDTLIATNNGVMNDRLFSAFKSGCRIEYSSAAALVIKPGGLGCSNSAGTTVRLRVNTENVIVAWSDLDTGAENVSTTYYVYAVGDADTTTFTVKISTSSSAPSGVTYFKQLGRFYNNASGNIEQINDDICKIAVAQGVIASGATIPLPTGFSESECKWTVSPNNAGTWDGGGDYMNTTTCSATGTRVVTMTVSGGLYPNSYNANYLIIGVRAGN